MTQQRWTDEEDDMVRVGYDAGTPCLVIAEKLGRTVDSIHGRASRLGLRHLGEEWFPPTLPGLPTLPYVPHITPGTNSKYQMVRPA